VLLFHQLQMTDDCACGRDADRVADLADGGREAVALTIIEDEDIDHAAGLTAAASVRQRRGVYGLSHGGSPFCSAINATGCCWIQYRTHVRSCQRFVVKFIKCAQNGCKMHLNVA
jgi:hypothetical protein